MLNQPANLIDNRLWIVFLNQISVNSVRHGQSCFKCTYNAKPHAHGLESTFGATLGKRWEEIDMMRLHHLDHLILRYMSAEINLRNGIRITLPLLRRNVCTPQYRHFKVEVFLQQHVNRPQEGLTALMRRKNTREDNPKRITGQSTDARNIFIPQAESVELLIQPHIDNTNPPLGIPVA